MSTSDDHKYIWLAPRCATEHYCDDRCWCSTPEELTCEECGAKPIAYVRAGKPTADLVSKLSAMTARAEAAEADVSRQMAIANEAVNARIAAEAKLSGVDALIDASKRLFKGASWMHDVLVGKSLAGGYDAAAMERADDATMSAIRKVERALLAIAARGK